MKAIKNLTLLTLVAGAAMFAQDGTGKMAGSGKMVNSKDTAFAKTAAGGGMAEVELGQIALKNADSQKVKDFAQKMVDDHSKANDELKTIAMQKNVALPTSLPPKEQAMVDKLSKLNGAPFDKAYMAAMLKDHHTDISEFEKEANSGEDSDLKGFASKTLPVLKSHLDMAKDAASSVGASGR